MRGETMKDKSKKSTYSTTFGVDPFIVASAPEIIFAEVSSSADESEIMRRFKSDPAWASTPAVKGFKICFIHRDIATIPSPRVLEALRIMREFCAKN